MFSSMSVFLELYPSITSKTMNSLRAQLTLNPKFQHNPSLATTIHITVSMQNFFQLPLCRVKRFPLLLVRLFEATRTLAGQLLISPLDFQIIFPKIHLFFTNAETLPISSTFFPPTVCFKPISPYNYTVPLVCNMFFCPVISKTHSSLAVPFHYSQIVDLTIVKHVFNFSFHSLTKLFSFYFSIFTYPDQHRKKSKKVESERNAFHSRQLQKFCSSPIDNLMLFDWKHENFHN